MTTYYITVCAHKHREHFQRSEIAELMVATFFQCRDAGEFELHEYVVMPDHIHVLLSLRERQSLDRAVQAIKERFARVLREQGSFLKDVWQPQYHFRRVSNSEELREGARYIRQNPVRKGLVAAAEQYSYSSAGKRAENAGLDPVSTEARSANAGGAGSAC